MANTSPANLQKNGPLTQLVKVNEIVNQTPIHCVVDKVFGENGDGPHKFKNRTPTRIQKSTFAKLIAVNLKAKPNTFYF